MRPVVVRARDVAGDDSRRGCFAYTLRLALPRRRFEELTSRAVLSVPDVVEVVVYESRSVLVDVGETQIRPIQIVPVVVRIVVVYWRLSSTLIEIVAWSTSVVVLGAGPVVA